MNLPARICAQKVSLLVWIFAAALAVAVRLWTASVGDNYDMESWWIASEAMRHDQSVYAMTHRYNYGPLWFFILDILRSISARFGSDTITSLHLCITALLSCIDIGLAVLLSTVAPPVIALLFLLNPISAIVSGYHIQFDNLAILLGLLSWRLFLSANSSTRVIVAALLFGASLTMKHVFSVFLAWLPFLTSVQSLSRRAIFGGVGLLTFALSFTPWLSDPASAAGINANVLRYVSTEGHSLSSFLAALCAGVPERTFFLTAVALVGLALLRRRDLHAASPFVYLIALTALSSGMARNYLAVPLCGLFLFWRSWSSWIYLVIATLALVTVHPSLGVSEVVAHLFETRAVTYEAAQLTLLFALAEVWIRNHSSPNLRSA